MIFSKCCGSVPMVSGTKNIVTVSCPKCGNGISFGHSLKELLEIKEICKYYWSDLVAKSRKEHGNGPKIEDRQSGAV